MSVQRDIQTWTSGKPLFRYRRGVFRTSDSSGVRVEHIDSGADTARDMARLSVPASRSWPGDPFLPAKTVDVIGLPGGAAWRITRYGQTGDTQLDDTGTLIAEYEPMTRTLEWWETVPGSGVVNTEYNNSTEQDEPVPWNREIEITHIMVPTILKSNPIGTVDHMINRLNSNNFDIDNITDLPPEGPGRLN